MNEQIKRAKEALEILCGEVTDYDRLLDKYPQAQSEYLETEGYKNALKFNKETEGAVEILKNAINELTELKEFTQIVFNKNVFIWGMAYRKNEVKDYKPTYEYYKNNCGYFHSGYKFELMTETEFELVKKVVEKYGETRSLRT